VAAATCRQVHSQLEIFLAFTVAVSEKMTKWPALFAKNLAQMDVISMKKNNAKWRPHSVVTNQNSNIDDC
jgi:hypothetical protein